MPPSFLTISPGIRTVTNHAEFDTSRAVQGVNARRNKILVLGRRLSTGSVDELVPKQVLSGDQAELYHGTGSELAEMVRAAKKANSQTEMWSCGIEPLTAGTAGTKTITITGPAGADGTIQLRIAGRFYVPVAVASGDVENSIATAMNAAIQAHPEYKRMPFTSAVATNVVTLTMRWKGIGVADARLNYYSSESTPVGLTVEIATGVAGAGNPDVTQLLDAIGDTVQYDSIVTPFTDPANLTALETELKSRWGGMRQIDGVAFAAVTGTHATATTLGKSRNSAFLCLMAANTSPTPPWIWAAVVAAVEAAEPDPARPRQGLTLPGILPASPTEQWGQSDRNLLLYSGCATHVVDSGGNVAIERLITTYQENSLGVPDTALLDIETERTASAIRYDGNVSVSLAFPRHKLAKDGVRLPVGQPIVTPNTMRGFLDGKYDQWTALGWVEGEAKEQFMSELLVEIDPLDPNRLVAQAGPDFVNQFRGMSMQWQFIV
jgi:phage tail sheath gpL-like